MEVQRAVAGRFEALMATHGVCIIEIGTVIKDKRVSISDNGTELVDISIDAVRAAWGNHLT